MKSLVLAAAVLLVAPATAHAGAPTIIAPTRNEPSPNTTIAAMQTIRPGERVSASESCTGSAAEKTPSAQNNARAATSGAPPRDETTAAATAAVVNTMHVKPVRDRGKGVTLQCFRHPHRLLEGRTGAVRGSAPAEACPTGEEHCDQAAADGCDTNCVLLHENPSGSCPVLPVLATRSSCGPGVRLDIGQVNTSRGAARASRCVVAEARWTAAAGGYRPVAMTGLADRPRPRPRPTRAERVDTSASIDHGAPGAREILDGCAIRDMRSACHPV